MESFAPFIWPGTKVSARRGSTNPPAVIESFENAADNIPVGGGDIEWEDNGPDYTLEQSALHVTEGTYSLKLVSTQSGGISAGYNTAPVDLTGYSTLTLDVYVESVDTGGAFGISLDDNSAWGADDTTPVDGTGAYTLTVDLSECPDLSAVRIFIGITGANIGAVYLDNLYAS